MNSRTDSCVLVAVLTVTSALTSVACTRTREPSSTTTTTSTESDGARALPPPPLPHRSGADDSLDPATAAAAERAVVPDRSDTAILPPPLPRTAAPPSAPPTATPGAPQTGVAVVPEGHAEPVVVPAELPPGIPPARTGDAGRR